MKGLSSRFMNISSLITLLTSFLGNSDSSIVPPCVCFNKKSSGWQAIAEMQRCQECICQYPLVNSYQLQSSLFSLCLIYLHLLSCFSLLSPAPSQPCFFSLSPETLGCCSLRLHFQEAAAQQSSGGCGECD